jgi:transposase
MSKRRAVVLAVTVEVLTQAEAARRYEVSRSFVSHLVARYQATIAWHLERQGIAVLVLEGAGAGA